MRGDISPYPPPIVAPVPIIVCPHHVAERMTNVDMMPTKKAKQKATAKFNPHYIIKSFDKSTI